MTNVKLDIDKTSEGDLEELVMRKACRKYFKNVFENMSKDERKKSFYKILKRVIHLETLFESDEAVKKGTGGVLEDEKQT